MLRKQLLASSIASSASAAIDCESASILSEFEVENSYYRVVLLSGFDFIDAGSADPTLEDKLRSILTAFLRDAGIETFLETERFALKGQLCIIVETSSSAEQVKQPVLEMAAILTDRELQIAALVALGKVNKQIAKQLHISEWTVATYLRRMFAKLRVDSRAALVYRCAPLIQKFQSVGAAPLERPTVDRLR